jgi:hypothetical protein
MEQGAEGRPASPEPECRDHRQDFVWGAPRASGDEPRSAPNVVNRDRRPYLGQETTFQCDDHWYCVSSISHASVPYPVQGRHLLNYTN